MQKASDVLNEIMSGKSGSSLPDMLPLRPNYTMDFLNAEWNRICPKTFLEFDVDRFPPGRDKFSELMSVNLSKEGALLFGDTRRGKTRGATQMLKKAHYSGFVCSWVDSDTFASECVAALRGDTERHFYKDMLSPQILLLDDLGKSKLTQRVTEGFFQVIDKRSRALKTTIITTNETGESLANRCEDKELAEAAIRRLKEFCRIVNL